MPRKILLAALAVAALMASSSSTATAAPISRNNPYRSFNITGINNASLQWERMHRQVHGQSRSRPTHSVGWRLFQRRS
jgi:hypothetical protein